MNWDTIELKGYSYYSEKGYRILIPLIHNNGYDFVAEKDGEFLRVNVKTAGPKDPSQGDSWAISKSGAQGKESCDIYLVWHPTDEKFIELDGNFLEGHKCRRLPKHMIC